MWYLILALLILTVGSVICTIYFGLEHRVSQYTYPAGIVFFLATIVAFVVNLGMMIDWGALSIMWWLILFSSLLAICSAVHSSRYGTKHWIGKYTYQIAGCSAFAAVFLLVGNLCWILWLRYNGGS